MIIETLKVITEIGAVYLYIKLWVKAFDVAYNFLSKLGDNT